MKSSWRLYQNYIIIAILSFVSVVILPMFGSAIGLSFIIPNTTAGWIVYIGTKVAIILINVLIFDQFMRQAKVNVKDNELFIKAEEILRNIDDPEEEIIATNILIARMYRSKVISTIIFTILGVFGFTQAILTFDYVQMLSYALTVFIGLVFGWVAMNQAEDIWTTSHYKWALKVKRDLEAKLKESQINTEEVLKND